MGALDWLKSVNDYLEEVPMGVTAYFKALTSSGEELVQSEVDKVCIWLAWKVNVMVERKRQQVIATLYDSYGGYLSMFAGVSVVQKALSDPIGAIGGFLGKFAAPIKAVIGFLATLMVEIPRLAANLANIANSLPPEPPNPRINFHAFKLSIKSISFGEVVRGTEGMPTPEEMFPAPTPPFSKEAFNDSFDNAKNVKSDTVKYYMGDKTIKEKVAEKKEQRLKEEQGS